MVEGERNAHSPSPVVDKRDNHFKDNIKEPNYTLRNNHKSHFGALSDTQRDTKNYLYVHIAEEK